MPKKKTSKVRAVKPTKRKPMSEAEYVAASGAGCPCCRSFNVEGVGCMESRDEVMVNSLECFHCGATWDDVFSLSGYENLKPGRPVVAP